MKGDFSRVTFDPANHFSRVLTQQGRVTLDADQNEQTDIALHMMRTLVRDLFGKHGGPANGRGFGLYVDTTASPNRLMIGAGHYYVDGILCECGQECDYAQQPDYVPVPATSALSPDLLLTWLQSPNNNNQAFWVYLDVWERHITWVEDDRIREVALGGPDTCTRTKVVWQVKSAAIPALVDTLNQRIAVAQRAQTPNAQLIERLKVDLNLLKKGPGEGICEVPLDAFDSISNAQMAARLDPGVQIADPCSISPDAQYRGAENQLYRIEIHQGGMLADGSPTFKWSRDNGSVLAGWLATDGSDLVVTSSRGFNAGCWVELSYDQLDLQGLPGTLVKLASVQGDRLTVATDSTATTQSIAWAQQFSNPKIRRWDQSSNDEVTLTSGAVPIVEATATDPAWIDLEDGLQIQFAVGGQYRSGDYWLVPARVATGSIEWPAAVAADGTPEKDQNGNAIPALEPPKGVHHHYAPLGFVGYVQAPDGQEAPGVHDSCRHCCSPLTAAICGFVSAPTASAPVRGLIALRPTAARQAAPAKKKSRGGNAPRASGKPSTKRKRR
jgi:Family of unknown function (DUF6519)